MFCMMVNGHRVLLAVALNGRCRVHVDGSFWGYYDDECTAIKAAVAVLQAPRFH